MSNMKSKLALALVLPLGMALATTTTSPAWSNTAGALQLDPPAAPSNCRTTTVQDNHNDYPVYIAVVTWSDNSNNEDGFTLEAWVHRSGVWILDQSVSKVANSTRHGFSFLRRPHNYRFRVKAFNASGDSSWSNWAH